MTLPRIGDRIPAPIAAPVIQSPPTAAFTVAVAAHVATFTDASSDVAPGIIVARDWTFGDETPPATPAPLLVGMWDSLPLIGLGPGGLTPPAGPQYGVCMGIPSTPSAIPGLLAAAAAAGVHLILNLVHSPTAYCDVVPNPAGGNFYHFNWTKYKGWLDQSLIYPQLATALAAHTASIHVIDEPLASYYDNTITRLMVNQMGLETKSRFPGAICIVRAASNVFALADIPAGGWTGIDFGIAQYGRFPVGSTLPNELPGAYWTRQVSVCGASGVRIVPGLNLWDGGDSKCWDYLFTGSSTGRFHGTITTGNLTGVGSGAGEPCNVTPKGTYWQASPAVMKEVIDAAVNHASAAAFPYFIIWTHALSNFNPNGSHYRALEARGDFVKQLQYMINTGQTRAAWSGWGTIK